MRGKKFDKDKWYEYHELLQEVEDLGEEPYQCPYCTKVVPLRLIDYCSECKKVICVYCRAEIECCPTGKCLDCEIKQMSKRHPVRGCPNYRLLDQWKYKKNQINLKERVRRRNNAK